jgi:hypothetical protein
MEDFTLMNKHSLLKKASYLLFALPAYALFAQHITTPVSASDPYGIDFSQITGDVIQAAEYKGNDLDELTLSSITSYKDGSITKIIQYDDGTARLTTSYLYSEDDALISISGADMNGNMRWKYLYKYDAHGNQIEEKSLNASNMVEWRIESTYTASGKLKTNTTYNASDDVTLKETFQYNDRGFISADITQYPDGKLLKRIIYSYTKGGHIAQEDHYDAVGFFERVGYSYTEGGDIVSFSNSGKDYSLNSRTLLQYGLNGKIIKETITGKDNSLTEINYVYDDRNNWIWRYDGKTYTLRKILYRK